MYVERCMQVNELPKDAPTSTCQRCPGEPTCIRPPTMPLYHSLNQSDRSSTRRNASMLPSLTHTSLPSEPSSAAPAPPHRYSRPVRWLPMGIIGAHNLVVVPGFDQRASLKLGRHYPCGNTDLLSNCSSMFEYDRANASQAPRITATPG